MMNIESYFSVGVAVYLISLVLRITLRLFEFVLLIIIAGIATQADTASTRR